MNLYKYINEKVNRKNVYSLEKSKQEIAIVRLVLKELAGISYRDYTFFLNKENLIDRGNIYNKKLDLDNVHKFAIVCKSYCELIKKILKENYDIDAELISAFDDEFRHIDLMVKTKDGKSYIVDPLSDLLEMQVGMRTNNFASKEYYDDMYSQKLQNISFLNEQELKEIDDKIGYKNNSVYLDDFFKLLKTKLDNIEDILSENQDISMNIFGKEYIGQEISDSEKTELKLRLISQYLNNRENINGITELLMFSNINIKKIFTEEEQSKIKASSFFVDGVDIKDKNIKEMFKTKEERKRGIVVSYNGRNFVFSLTPKTLEYKDEEWNKVVRENNIYIRPKYDVKLLKFLKVNGANRNIVHNNEFLRLFSKFENSLIKKGKSLEEIKENNILINADMILTQYGEAYIGYKIENGNLVVKDYKKNCKHIVFYGDEGRKISYKTEPILRENEKLNLYEFDSNGLFNLDEVTGIEDMVEPLKGGDYLSRNKSYYQKNTYSELEAKRKELKKILTEDLSKKNFVILEYLANSSAKVYFEELKRKIENQDNNVIQAKKCFEEDCENIVRFFQSKPLLKPKYDLPKGNNEILDRHIELDNKQILYMFCSNLNFRKQKHIITPGLGSIFVGPMLKSMYGFNYSNVLFSLYSNDEKLRNISNSKQFNKLFSDDEWNTTANEILLIDDNVASCSTMNTIRKELERTGKTCKFGAVKYNWKFYNQVMNGELEHPTFNINEVDFLTIFDDPGYWIMRDSINELKKEGGEAYIRNMKKEGLQKVGIPDIVNLMKRAEYYSQNVDVDLYDINSKKIKKSSAFLCKKLKEQINEISRDSNFKGREKDE